MITSRARSRRLGALTSLVVGGALTLSGCQITSPRQTEVMYEPADGVSVTLGQVKVDNMVVISEKEGGPGLISAAVGNPTSEPATITFATTDGGTATAEVPAHGTANLSVGDSPAIHLPKIDVRPGAMVNLMVGTKTAGSSPVSVPVLLPTGYYETLAATLTSLPPATTPPAGTEPTASASPTSG